MNPCLCAAARHASRAITALYEAEMQVSGLHPAQFEILSWIASIPNITQRRLSDGVGTDQTTLSRNLKLMISRGWIQALPDKNDRRQVVYSTTVEGREALRSATAGWNRAQRRMERALAGDLSKIQTALNRLAKAAGS